jgi:hypothetical protein
LRLRASREDEFAAESGGIDIGWTRLVAFVVSAAIMGVAGGLYALSIGSFSSADFFIDLTILLFAMMVVGGMRSLSGAVFAEVDSLIRPEVLIASSSSALTVSGMQTGCRRPERVVLGHPFNPPHIMPLVEIAAGVNTSPEALDRATEFYEALGKSPIRMNKEVYGHVANRIQGAVFREAIHMLESGVASLGDIDRAITDGPGLRWALMGPFLTYHLAGGAGGMASFMQQFAPMQQKLWGGLGTPTLDESLQDKGDCQESCVGGHNDADGGRLWQSGKTRWINFWMTAIERKFSTRMACSMS